MIREEYTRFLETLTTQSTAADVRRVGNLVLKHLDELVPLSTSQGQRIKKLVQLAQVEWNSISENIQNISQQNNTHSTSFTRLKSLSIGPFRGFAKQEHLDLSSRIVLIFGPNGTGKSSFCEALEFALLGTIAEAESKRFRPQDYIKNAHTNSSTPPVLVGIDSTGIDVPISKNEPLYRFCFVEKNRIDGFSRIAAQAPARQTELISTLFGLDAFAEFVRDFTDSMDGRYIDLEGVKAKQLAKKRETLAAYHLQLSTTIPTEIQNVENEEKALAETHRQGCTFVEVVDEIQGTKEKTGLIRQIETDLQTQLPQKSGITIANLEALKMLIEDKLKELETKQKELSKVSQQVSFKQLYEAVIKVQEISSDRCPACLTPIEQVTVNPFDHSNTEVKKLGHLGQLQEETKNLQSDVLTSLSELSQLVNACCARFKEDNPLSVIKVDAKNVPTIDWWKLLHQKTGDKPTFVENLMKQVKSLEDEDRAIDKAVNELNNKRTELAKLRGFDKKIGELKTRKDLLYGNQRTAKEAISKFETENAALITSVEVEKEVVAQNQRIAEAYNAFIKELTAYKEALPAQLVADLGDTVVTLYNAFNRHDSEHEKLAKIILPLSQSQRLKISFRREPEKYHDALHILSEGHIRCIGLAILTAKNLKEDCSLLIFDDPVNAIDDDHRESIRRTLFEDSFFSGKQMIVTCHGEEFLKDIQNLLPVEQALQAKTVSFLPQNGAFHISVDPKCAPRNYIIAARAHFEKNEIRDALDKSRKALECLTKGKVWRYVNRYGDGNLSIKMRTASSPIELRNLTEQLKSKIEKLEFADPNKDSVLTPIKSLLGIDGTSREWSYLNKGTHEEENRAEFNRPTVDKIVTDLEAIDNALKDERS